MLLNSLPDWVTPTPPDASSATQVVPLAMVLDMAERTKKQRVTNPREAGKSGSTDQTSTTAPDTEKTDRLKAELDGLLDEIDEVLETNAEDFVKSYVQKGGQ
jgi:ubiquitin-like protein Pup